MGRWRIATPTKDHIMNAQTQQQGNPDQTKPGEDKPGDKREDTPKDPSQKQNASPGQSRSHDEVSREQQNLPGDKQRI